MLTRAEEVREAMTYKHFDRSFILAQAGGQCVKCGKVADTFNNTDSVKEYHLIGYCQDCQDKHFEV